MTGNPLDTAADRAICDAALSEPYAYMHTAIDRLPRYIDEVERLRAENARLTRALGKLYNDIAPGANTADLRNVIRDAFAAAGTEGGV